MYNGSPDLILALISGPLVICGSVLLLYCLYRQDFFTLKWFRKPPREDWQGKGIDVTDVSDRLKHLREGLKENKVPGANPDFKLAKRVESKREEIAELAFFQTPHPPPPEDTEHGHRQDLILV